MGQFLTELQLKRLKPEKRAWWKFWALASRWELLAALVYLAADGTKYTVPKGFITDGASVPWLFWAVISPTGALFAAAVLHDWLYSEEAKLLYGIKVERSQADALFREAAESDGAGSFKRNAAWAGVRVGGWAYWYD